MKILIVEDQPTTAGMLRAYFETQGYEVDTVGWGEDALALAEKTIPDLVILDIRLPDIDGYEVCRRLQAHERTKHVPVIFLTEKRKESARLKGLDLDAVDYIRKPFDIQELRWRVRNVLQRSHAGRSSHHITKLPTGAIVDEQLAELLGRRDWAALSVGLHGLKQFSDTYGLMAQDDLVRSVAAILTRVRDDQAPGAFIGHLDTADFLVVLDRGQVDRVQQTITTRLTEALSLFSPRPHRPEAASSLPLTFSTQVLRPPTQPLEDVEDLKAALIDARERRSTSGP